MGWRSLDFTRALLAVHQSQRKRYCFVLIISHLFGLYKLCCGTNCLFNPSVTETLYGLEPRMLLLWLLLLLLCWDSVSCAESDPPPQLTDRLRHTEASLAEAAADGGDEEEPDWLVQLRNKDLHTQVPLYVQGDV